MIYNTCYIAPVQAVLSHKAFFIALLYSITGVLYSKAVTWQIWLLYSSDPRFQMSGAGASARIDNNPFANAAMMQRPGQSLIAAGS